MCAQDVLPRIVVPVNSVSTCPSLVVLGKKRRGVLNEFVATSHLPHKQPQRHLQILPTFPNLTVNYRHIRFFKVTLLLLFLMLFIGIPTCSKLKPADASITRHSTDEIIQVCV